MNLSYQAGSAVCFSAFFTVMGAAVATSILANLVPRRFWGPENWNLDVPGDAVRDLRVEYFERRGEKIYIRINNPTDRMYSQPRIRVVARKPSGELINESDTLNMCQLPPNETTEFLVPIYADEEFEAILSPENTLSVELTGGMA